MSKTLVVYFSATGQTEELAKTIARATSGNLCAIHPAQPYTKEDLNWQDPESRSTLEMKNPETRPALSKPTPCLDCIRDYVLSGGEPHRAWSSPSWKAQTSPERR